MSRAVQLSRSFVEDREGRGLECGVLLSSTPAKVTVQADQDTLQDMMDDAAYQGWHTDAELCIRNAAQAAFRHLHAAGVQCRQGIQMRRGRVLPGDAR